MRMDLELDLSACLKDLHANIAKVIVGKDEEISLLLTAMLANGHVLIEDVPGVGKTTLIKTLARSLGADFRRVQFTPDVLPGDLTGVSIYDPKSQQFTFHPGPIMCNILLADEINRASPKTQSALLECMEERQVSVDGITHALPQPFFVMATQNPREFHGTFPLPESQVDRFMFTFSLGYPSFAEEIAILDRFQTGDPLTDLPVVLPIEKLPQLQAQVRKVYVSPVLRQYLVNIVDALRNSAAIALGVSPRGTLSLFRAAQAYAALNGRTHVLPDDIKYLAVPALHHRFRTTNTLGTDAVIKEVLDNVPIPLT